MQLHKSRIFYFSIYSSSSSSSSSNSAMNMHFLYAIYAAFAIVMVLYLAVLFVLSFLLCGGHYLTGIGIPVTALVCFGIYRHMAMKYFGGMTGDLAGWFVTYSETAMVLAGVLLAAVY